MRFKEVKDKRKRRKKYIYMDRENSKIIITKLKRLTKVMKL